MTNVSEDTASIAVLSTKLDHVTKTMEEIKISIATSATIHVTRSEWELRNQTVDERFINSQRERDELRLLIAAQDAKKAPWWTVLAAFGSIVAIIGLTLQWIPQIVNP
ncbi:hypothetical protein SEA_ALOEVERA_41 [Microbacterium phage AloeVera]|uniref:Uncharacterized protein n=3 Tax=Akonivirus akoni TaxID=2845587 RepID=A0A6M3T1A5_9CAUD|nr:membrane protein [Microbacterium phage Akoni]QCG78326.1 hypothetical protein SEA_AKONI_40 [Microbacterium phage Akoni]QJD51290.1 hypothetical protein SEA_TRUONG_40 [Microbacterium phage Truong]QJD51780.1 hypothetical protein SEA_ASHTON_41 [Microbacterium phage Ashton]